MAMSVCRHIVLLVLEQLCDIKKSTRKVCSFALILLTNFSILAIVKQGINMPRVARRSTGTVPLLLNFR